MAERRPKRRSAVLADLLNAVSAADKPEQLEVWRHLESLGVGEEEKLETKTKKPHPSTFVQRMCWRAFQFRSSPKFICYRGPKTATPRLPVLLLHTSFMEVIQQVEAGQVEAADIVAAQNFCAKLTPGFDHEVAEMMPGVNEALGDYLGYSLLETCMLGDDEITGGLMDGYLKLRSPILLAEYKLEEDPWFQLLAYAHLCFSRLRRAERTSHVLGLLVMGVYIQLVGIVWDEKRQKVVAEPLSDFVCVVGPEKSTALKVARLLRSIKNFTLQYQESSIGDVEVPWQLTSWQATKLDDFVFLCHGHPDHGTVVVKVCMEYGSEAHKAWHGSGVAPQFMEEKELGCEWKMVIMEWLSPSQGWKKASEYAEGIRSDKKAMERLQKAAQDALDKGHKTGYCHGDFRLDNLMLKLAISGTIEEVRALDFEFSGLASKDKYPYALSSAIDWHPDAEFGKTVEKDHDTHFVKAIVDL